MGETKMTLDTARTLIGMCAWLDCESLDQSNNPIVRWHLDGPPAVIEVIELLGGDEARRVYDAAMVVL